MLHAIETKTKEELCERIRQLETEMGIHDPLLFVLPFTPAQRQMIGMLLKREVVSREIMHMTIHLFGSENRLQSVDPQICYLRKKLQKWGVVIESCRGVGWRMPKASKKKLLAVMREHD